MSIEETYKGMWSSDPDLLKSLLDAGETILGRGLGGKLYSLESTNGVAYWIGEENYSWAEFFEDWIIGYGVSFLIPPRPLVLEPKPLEWVKIDDGYFEAKDGAFTYQVDSSGFWSVDNVAYYPNTATDTESAKAAIQEWRVNHLKSMLP